MKESNFFIIEKGDILDDLSLDMVLGGAIGNEAAGMDCDHCNSCGDGGNNSNNSIKEEARINIG